MTNTTLFAHMISRYNELEESEYTIPAEVTESQQAGA